MNSIEPSMPILARVFVRPARSICEVSACSRILVGRELGCARAYWFCTVGVVAKHFRVVLINISTLE
jgi:hypothetical protein